MEREHSSDEGFFRRLRRVASHAGSRILEGLLNADIAGGMSAMHPHVRGYGVMPGFMAPLAPYGSFEDVGASPAEVPPAPLPTEPFTPPALESPAGSTTMPDPAAFKAWVAGIKPSDFQ